MRAASNMSNNVASESCESTVNVDNSFSSLHSLESIAKMSGFISDNFLNAAYALTREERLKRFSSLAV